MPRSLERTLYGRLLIAGFMLSVLSCGSLADGLTVRGSIEGAGGQTLSVGQGFSYTAYDSDSFEGSYSEQGMPCRTDLSLSEYQTWEQEAYWPESLVFKISVIPDNLPANIRIKEIRVSITVVSEFVLTGEVSNEYEIKLGGQK